MTFNSSWIIIRFHMFFNASKLDIVRMDRVAFVQWPKWQQDFQSGFFNSSDFLNINLFLSGRNEFVTSDFLDNDLSFYERSLFLNWNSVEVKNPKSDCRIGIELGKKRIIPSPGAGCGGNMPSKCDLIPEVAVVFPSILEPCVVHNNWTKGLVCLRSLAK